MDKTIYELPWTGEQTEELIGKINTIESALSTSIFKKPEYAGKVAVFDGNGDLTYASESAYIPSSKYLGYQDFQYLATASATTGVPLVENFSIDSTPISAAAGIQRIKTNQVLTGQIVANNNATVSFNKLFYSESCSHIVGGITELYAKYIATVHYHLSVIYGL